jgi:hypothetical protein
MDGIVTYSKCYFSVLLVCALFSFTSLPLAAQPFISFCLGIHRTETEAEQMYDVVFDKPFPGGLSLNCSASRGYRLSRPAILNLSYGQRTEQMKTVNKPTAVVQPSGKFLHIVL